METSNIREFFDYYLRMVSSLLDDDHRLRFKERQFLVECCMYNYNGGDLNNSEKLLEYLSSQGVVQSVGSLNQYKHILKVRGWAKTGKRFELKGVLDQSENNPKPLKYNFNLEYIPSFDEEVSDR